MKRLPEIAFDTPEQVREVYDHVRRQKPLKVPIRMAYTALNAWFDPYVTYDDGARDDLDRAKRDGNPRVYVFNHQDLDYMTVGAIQHEVMPYDVGKIRTLANDQTFKKVRLVAEAMGAVPLTRKVDYKDNLESVMKSKLAIAEATYAELFSCCVDLLHDGQPIALYPEGDVNRHEPWLYPSYIDIAKNGAAVIATRAATPDLPTALVAIGHTNGPGNLHKPKRGKVSAHVGRTIFVSPDDKVPDVTNTLRKRLQHAVTVASATR